MPAAIGRQSFVATGSFEVFKGAQVGCYAMADSTGCGLGLLAHAPHLPPPRRQGIESSGAVGIGSCEAPRKSQGTSLGMEGRYLR